MSTHSIKLLVRLFLLLGLTVGVWDRSREQTTHSPESEVGTRDTDGAGQGCVNDTGSSKRFATLKSRWLKSIPGSVADHQVRLESFSRTVLEEFQFSPLSQHVSTTRLRI